MNRTARGLVNGWARGPRPGFSIVVLLVAGMVVLHLTGVVGPGSH